MLNNDHDTDSKSSFGWFTGLEIERQVREGGVVIEPFENHLLNPNSYNYRLSPALRRLTNEVIDLRKPDDYEDIIISEDGTMLMPGECYLGCTYEVLGSMSYASLITGRSSIGRKFVTNHVTAGLIDVGFIGQITLEVTVVKPTIVYPYIPFGQIFWFTVKGALLNYNGKYQSQRDPTISLIYQDNWNVGGK